jgi:hypothetical protein
MAQAIKNLSDPDGLHRLGVGSMIGTISVSAFLGLWLALSLVNQVRNGRYLRRAKDLDVAALIPCWTFFAPRPGITDFDLIYRDAASDGFVTPWRVVRRPGPDRARWLWHPAKRHEKLVTDCVSNFLRGYDPQQRGHLIDLSYLVLLAMVERVGHDFRAEGTQFAIVGTSAGSPTTDLLFVSDFVRLSAAAS